jgi:hypothetical protein
MLAVVAAALAMWGIAKRLAVVRAAEPRNSERRVRWAMVASASVRTFDLTRASVLDTGRWTRASAA